MSFYYKNLESTIFNAHKSENLKLTDQLIIISGYLGPGPIEKLKTLPFKVTIIAGMYKSGVNKSLYNTLQKSMNKNNRLKIYFSNMEVHSKIYIWLKHGTPKLALIGSANFSDNGLRTDYRETLADINIENNSELLNYYNIVLNNSTENPKLSKGPKVKNNKGLLNNTNTKNGELSIELPLYKVDKKNIRIVPKKSGLNWGLSPAHTSEGDAYIAIPKEIIQTVPDFFRPFDPFYKNTNKKNRNSDPIEIIWDDGKVMKASVEGKQKLDNGLNYPKQISSYSSNTNKLKHSVKSILGRYLRRRMQIPVNHTITYSDLIEYGRTSITFIKISEGVYSADFSLKAFKNK